MGTINRWAAGFPECLKQIKPPKGTYVSKRINDKTYIVFSDRKLVSFLSNAFPESMNDKVARVQAGGLLGYQAVTPPLPAYNKFMGGVDRAGQLRKTYGFDRKCKRSWVRLFSVLRLLHQQCLLALQKQLHQAWHEAERLAGISS